MTKHIPFLHLALKLCTLTSAYASFVPTCRYSSLTNTSAAQRWFLFDSDYFKQTCGAMDYAVVGHHATDITRTLKQVDNRPHPEYEDFGELLDDAVVSDHLWFAQAGTMVYADVNGTKAHVAAMQARELRHEYQNRSRFDLINADQERLLGLYKAAGAKHHDTGDKYGSKTQGKSADSLRISSRMIDHIISLKTKQEKKTALSLLSGEIVFKAPRPILILINIFDDSQSTIPGTGSGRVIAYDPIEDEIYKKNYTSSPYKHPLGDSWHASPKLKIATGQLARFIANRENMVGVNSSQYGF
ncbi:MAG: hypothetical protein M1812_006920 [Candelaria pacifica]|nr:MAG: hypothetical protein M1812_006920 [Candelaria pacifica]